LRQKSSIINTHYEKGNEDHLPMHNPLPLNEKLFKRGIYLEHGINLKNKLPKI
jgi:hypothetical protein